MIVLYLERQCLDSLTSLSNEVVYNVGLNSSFSMDVVQLDAFGEDVVMMDLARMLLWARQPGTELESRVQNWMPLFDADISLYVLFRDLVID